MTGDRATMRERDVGEEDAEGEREWSFIVRESERLGELDFGDAFHSSPSCVGVPSVSTESSLAADSLELRARSEFEERRELVAEFVGDMKVVESDDSDRRGVTVDELERGY